MSRIIFGLVLFATIFAQATLIPAYNPLRVGPDLVVVLLFLWAGFCGPREGLFWVFVSGVVLDILGLDPLGTNALALVIVVVVAGLLKGRMLFANVVATAVLVVFVTLFHAGILYLLRGSAISLSIPLQALFNAVLVPFIYIPMRRMLRIY